MHKELLRAKGINLNKTVILEIKKKNFDSINLNASAINANVN